MNTLQSSPEDQPDGLPDRKKVLLGKKYVLDIGDGKRGERCHNISITLLPIWNKLSDSDRLSGEKYVCKDELRTLILSKTGEQYKDKHGDSRAHGDACGGHGLHLEMEGNGAKAKIWLNVDNINKCIEYLKGEDKPKPLPKEPNKINLL